MSDITPDDAVKLADKNAKFNGTVLGKYKGQDISLHKGRFGRYIKFGDKNIRIPKTVDLDSLDYNEAIKVLQTNPSKKRRK